MMNVITLGRILWTSCFFLFSAIFGIKFDGIYSLYDFLHISYFLSFFGWQRLLGRRHIVVNILVLRPQYPITTHDLAIDILTFVTQSGEKCMITNLVAKLWLSFGVLMEQLSYLLWETEKPRILKQRILK